VPQLRCRRVSVFGGVVFGGLFGVVFGLHMMAVRQVGMVAGLFVIAGLVVLRRRTMVLGGVLMMLRCIAVMFSCCVRHGNPLFGEIEKLSAIEDTCRKLQPDGSSIAAV